jgi:hypothetical protein
MDFSCLALHVQGRTLVQNSLGKPGTKARFDVQIELFPWGCLTSVQKVCLCDLCAFPLVWVPFARDGIAQQSLSL